MEFGPEKYVKQMMEWIELGENEAYKLLEIEEAYTCRWKKKIQRIYHEN